MTALLRAVLWSAVFLGSCAIARAAPMDDCNTARGAAALSACSQVVDDAKEKPATRALARLFRARAELDISDLERAEADIEAALAVTPNSPFAYRLRARLRTLQGKEAEARADFTKAVELPQSPTAKYVSYLERGHFFVRNMELPRALADFNAAVRLDPTKAAAYVGRAVASKSAADIPNALADLDRAKAVEPGFKPSFLERGEIPIAEKRYAEAVADFDAALALDPKDARALRGRTAANALAKAGGSAAPPQPAVAAPAAPPPAPMAPPKITAPGAAPGTTPPTPSTASPAPAPLPPYSPSTASPAAPATPPPTAPSTATPAPLPPYSPSTATPAAPPSPPPAAPSTAAPAPPPTSSPSTASPAAPPSPPPAAPSTAAPAAPPPGSPTTPDSPPPASPTTASPATPAPPSQANPAAQAAEARRAKLREALTLRQGGKHKEALAILEELLRAAPADVELTVEKGRTLVFLERWKDVIDTLKPVIESKTAPAAMKARAFEARGEVLARNNQFEAAILSNTAALEINPKLLGALFWRGLSAVSIGSFDMAVTDFQQAGTIVPTSALYPGWEALALVGNGDLAKARQAIDRSNTLQADNTFALTARARLRLVAGELDDAEADLAKLAQRGPLGAVALQTQQLIMIHKVFKPSDSPPAAKQ